MSQKREKAKRRREREEFLRAECQWARREPPKWRFLRHRKWEQEKPVLGKTGNR